jgi:hypothetical protein
MREKDGRVNLIKIHGKHICKCLNEILPIKVVHANKNVKEQNSSEGLEM